MESPLADKKTRMRFNKAMREKGIPAKACGKCFVVKGLPRFGMDRASADGKHTACTRCATDYTREPASRNRRNAASKRWQRENPGKSSEARRRWKTNNLARWRSSTRHSNALRRARIAAATIVPFTHDELMASWEDDGLYACVFCDGPFEEIEHILPLSRGGEHSIANLVPSCVDCNRGVGGKASRLPWEWLSERYPELAPILVPSVLPDVE